MNIAESLYDDGGSEIPVGVTGTPDRVIIVGAGIAGLTAANALANAGVECVVVEARQRIGGRLHTVDVGGSPVDMGGSWIHTPLGNPLRRFADQVGVACRPGNPLTDMAWYDAAESRQLNRDEGAALLDLAYGTFPAALEQLRAVLGQHATVAQGIERFVDDLRLDDGVARRARLTLRLIAEAENAQLPEHQSLKWLWNEIEYEGDSLGDLPIGGYRELVDALAAELPIRLGADVIAIDVSASGVVVTFANGSSETGSHVLVTVPLGVLKRNAIQFSPPLPSDRLAAISRLGFGFLEKIALSFDEPFWTASGAPNLFYLHGNKVDTASTTLIGLESIGTNPVLVCPVYASAQHQLHGRSPEDAAAWTLRIVSDALGFPCPDPTDIAMSSWRVDPYSAGSYTQIPPDASPADVDLLGNPLLGRLLFAGEATTSARMGYADGAMSSGIREAKRLLRQPTVTLGRRSGSQ